MKKRHLFAGILACALTLTLAACGLSGADVTTYIQGELDCTYKGQYSQEYLDLVDGMTEEDAKQQYEDNAQAEAQRLLNYLEVFYPNDEVNERATQLVKDIYAKAQYSVGEGNKLQGGDFAAEVILSPIEVFHLIPDETYAEIWSQVCADNGTTPDEASTLSEAALSGTGRGVRPAHDREGGAGPAPGHLRPGPVGNAPAEAGRGLLLPGVQRLDHAGRHGPRLHRRLHVTAPALPFCGFRLDFSSRNLYNKRYEFSKPDLIEKD